MSSGYIHNSKFSFRHLISQTERQLKSVGSFIPVLDIDYYVIDDKSSDINTQKSNNIELGIGPGYAYTFVFKEKLYFSVGGYTSFGYLKTKLKTRTDVGDIITNQDNFILGGMLKQALVITLTDFTQASIQQYQVRDTNRRIQLL
jgi:hypothetical protein